MDACQKDRKGQDGTIVMSRSTERHLRAALMQMDLLLESEQVDVGLAHLVALLDHLRQVGGSIY